MIMIGFIIVSHGEPATSFLVMDKEKQFLILTVYCFIFLTVNMIMIRFIIVSHGESSNIIPGHALVMDQEKQFAPLSKACGTACFAMSNWKLPMYVVPVPLSRYTGI